MKKITGLLILSMLSFLFVGCNAYQLASYYGDNDGIYVSSERGIDYEVVFSEYLQEPLDSYSSSENNSQYLPWGANPESTEIVNNFFPSFGRYYYDPFYFNMGLNPYFGYGGYGFGPSFYHNLFGYEMGYPFYGHYSFYFSPFATSPGSYYWYMMRHRRYMPWNYRPGGIYDTTVYKDQYNNIYSNSNRVSFSNSASRRGEDNSTSSISRKSDNQGVKISGLYSRTGNYGGVYTNRTRGANDYDVYERNMNRTEILNNNLTGVYSRSNSRSINSNRNNSIPNLSKIKSDYVKEAYRQARSVNPSQRGNPVYRSSSYDYSNSPSSNYFNNRSSRTNSSYRGSSPGSRSSGAVQARSFSSQSGGSRGSSGGSRGSSGGSRGSGNIN